MGVEAATAEFILVNKYWMLKCRTVRRLARSKAFNEHLLSEAIWAVDKCINKGARTTSPSITYDEAANHGVPGGRIFVPRRARLKPEYFEIFGFKDGCRGCVWLRDRIGARVNNSDDCRDRVEKKLDEDGE